jgi:hypothetical protein
MIIGKVGVTDLARYECSPWRILAQKLAIANTSNEVSHLQFRFRIEVG